MPLVVDANVVIRTLVPNQDRIHLRQAIDEWVLVGDGLVAPSLFLYELTSALVKSVHFGQVTEEAADSALYYAMTFPIRLIMPSPQLTKAAFEWSLRLQRANAYDAFYLALAEALGCELWTLDRRLVNAAGQDWVRSPIG